MTHLVLLNGASGVGKTSISNHLVEVRPSLGQIHPDGLWDTPEMESAAILNLAAEAAAALASEVVVIDCQIRPSDAGEVVALHADSWAMLLIDCPDQVREKRLLARGWSTESFPKVAHWQRLLRVEAEELGLPILDTSQLSLELCSATILKDLDERT